MAARSGVLRIGTAAWNLPASSRSSFPADGTYLQRYARVFSCVEINSTFYRSHRRSTFERWAASVPASFRFAIKVPRAITHEQRLVDTEALVDAFLDETSGLGAKRDVLLVQLPPKLAFEPPVAEPFFAALRQRYEGRVACEPRHASWFTREGDALLRTFRIARVAADPVVAGGLPNPGGDGEFQYWRLHGSPRIYWSAYEAEKLKRLARSFAADPNPLWCIFDNTAAGAATADALTLAAACATV